jgi:RNase P subunit RPR2
MEGYFMSKIVYCDKCNNMLMGPEFFKGKFLRNEKNNLVKDEKGRVIVKCRCGHENHLFLSFSKKE